MSQELFDSVGAHTRDLAIHLAHEIKQAQHPHYQAVELPLLEERTAQLVEAFHQSMRGDPRPFVSYVRLLSEARHQEGYYLEEIQTLLSMLEERVWTLVLEESPFRRAVSHLAVVTTVIGKAKDELARVYLEAKHRSDLTIEELTKRLAELQGTDPIVELGV
ncbi:MAG: hypothetical protein U0527_11765 [Candidatus Eisenbacteria bacterium]